MRFLMVSARPEQWSELAGELEKAAAVELVWAASGETALQAVQDKSFDLVLIDAALEDMTGLNLAQTLIKTNPMLNCALASGLSKQAFHEATEGLGLLAQLPLDPDASQARELLAQLTAIMKLTQRSG